MNDNTGMAESSQGLPAAAVDAVSKGNKIEAIKIVRQERGIGLKESKEAVEAYLAERPDLASQYQAASGGGKWVWALTLLIVMAILYGWLRR